jgi:hypothetical protein
MNPFFPAASELLSRLRRLLSKQGMSLQTERLVLEITEDHTFILVNSTDKKVRIDGRIELDPQSCMIVAGPGEHVYLQISQQLYDAPDLQTASHFTQCASSRHSWRNWLAGSAPRLSGSSSDCTASPTRP